MADRERSMERFRHPVQTIDDLCLNDVIGCAVSLDGLESMTIVFPLHQQTAASFLFDTF